VSSASTFLQSVADTERALVAGLELHALPLPPELARLEGA
jgi:hypothetical protein